MEIENTILDGVKILKTKTFADERGSFGELYNSRVFAENGLNFNFIQDNISVSQPGVLRGLHFQNPPQTKLVTCLSGKILDVVACIDKSSSQYGKYIAIELSSQDRRFVLVPKGYAHGFCVLGNQPATVLYKVDEFFNQSGDGGVHYKDPILNIKWPYPNPIVSQKDMLLSCLS